MSNWKFQLLGNFIAFTPKSNELQLPGRKHQALIAMVLLSENKSIPRDRVLDMLWGSRSEDQARASLRGVLSEIKRVCRPFGPCPIEADRSHIFVPDSTTVEVDIDALLRNENDMSIDSLAVVSTLSGGDLLASLKINESAFEQWKTIEQEQMKRAYRRILQLYMSELRETENPIEIELTANRMLDLDDADEDAHRALMQLYYQQNSRSRALHQFELCKEKIRKQYNSAVSEATANLAISIQAGLGEGDKYQSKPIYKYANTTTAGVNEISLAVMLFRQPEGSGIDRNFAGEIAEGISFRARYFKWFRVISTKESFRVQLKELGPSGVTETIGAKYILDGEIYLSKNSYHLKIELIDGISSNIVWSDVVKLNNQIFDNPEIIYEQILGRLDVNLRAHEIQHALSLKRKPATGYEFTLLALSNMTELESTRLDETKSYFQKAVELSPKASWIHSYWSLWKMFCLGQDWLVDKEQGFREANELARTAFNIDQENAIALVIAGHFQSLWEQNLELGQILVDRARKANPYSAFTWMLSSATYSYMGEPSVALQQLERAQTLSSTETHFQFMRPTALCLAHLFNRDLEQAEVYGKQLLFYAPGFTNGHKLLLVALGHLGKVSESNRYLHDLLEMEPDFNIRSFLDKYPFGKSEDRDFFREGFELAGAPSGRNGSKTRLSAVE